MDRPESQPLFLPHSLTQEDRDACTGDLGQIEERLRDAQLLASLDQLRVHLHIKSRLVTYKNRHVRHQVPNTRARRRIEVNEGKIIALAEKYRAARKAKQADFPQKCLGSAHILPCAGGPADLFFPQQFLGTWEVESTLTSVKMPLGPDYVPDLEVGPLLPLELHKRQAQLYAL